MLSGKLVNHQMKQIPSNISSLYNEHLKKKAIPKKDYFNYRKWLRYYLDFCFKYRQDQLNKESLKHFIAKLKEKRQNKQIYLYKELLHEKKIVKLVSILNRYFSGEKMDKYSGMTFMCSVSIHRSSLYDIPTLSNRSPGGKAGCIRSADIS